VVGVSVGVGVSVWVGVIVGVIELVGVIVGVDDMVGVILFVGVIVLVGVGVGVGPIVGQVNSNSNEPPTISVVTWTIIVVGVFVVFVKLFSYTPVNVVDDITILESQVTCTLELTVDEHTISILPVFSPTSNVYI